MAATNYTPISLYYSTTAAAVPTSGNLVAGELALNTVDEKLYFKNSAGTVKLLASSASTTNVASITFGSTGLTPSTATTGAVTVAGTLIAGNGGTGQSSYAVGDLLYASTTSALSKLADVATGNALISGGVGVAPSYGKIGLTTHVSGTLPVGNGGTGITTTPTNGQIPIGNGTNYVAATITAGTGITVTNASGAITIAASGTVSAATPTALGTVYGSTGASSTDSVYFGYNSGGGAATTYNVGIGYSVLSSASLSGNQNTGVGYQALTVNTSGSYNVAMGWGALSQNTSGSYNIGIGRVSLYSNTTASQNTAVGYGSLQTVTTAGNNTAFGYNALNANTTGPQNTAVGSNALTSNTTGGYNIAIGFQALNANTTGYDNIAAGYQSLYLNTGQNNVVVGSLAFRSNTTNGSNTGVGYSVGYSSTAAGSTYVGYRAGYYVTTGTNLGIGYQAIFGNTGGATGANNTAIGDQTLSSITTAGSNTVLGNGAGFSVTTGSNNILVGYQAGQATTALTTGSNNIIIGYNAYSSSATVSNEMTLGNSSNTSLRIPGISITWDTTSGLNSLGVGTPASGTTGEIRATNNITAYYSSDIKFKENVRDIPDALATVNAIGGKLFDWKDDYIESKGGADGYFVQKADFGVVAQDVQKVFPIAVRTREDGSLAVDYEKLGALAFAALVELTKRVEALEAK